MKKTVVSFLLFVCMCVCLKKSEKPFVLFLKKKITSPVKYFLYRGHLTNLNKHETDSNSTQTQINNLGFTQSGIPSWVRTRYSQRNRKR